MVFLITGKNVHLISDILRPLLKYHAHYSLMYGFWMLFTMLHLKF